MGFRVLADAVVSLFFRNEEVVDADRVPLDAPVMLVANHHSGLIDALLLYAFAPREIRAVGKSTLWKILPLRPFLYAARVIPIYRTQDGGGDNTRSFRAVTSALQDGGAIALFAEGTSHDNQGLERIKTGAARMALNAARAGADVVIVPVGIIFEDRQRWRSDVLMRFGEPFNVADTYPKTSSDDREAVRSLTSDIETRLRTVAPTWESDDERAAARTAAVRRLPIGSSLREIEDEAERLAAAGSLPHPDDAVVGDRGELDLLIPPDEVDTVAAAILAPVAIAGLLFNIAPYMTVATIASKQDFNIRATIKAIAACVVYPLWWAAIAAVVMVVSGSLNAGLIVAGIVALLGLIAGRELPLARDERRTLKLSGADRRR